MSAHEEIARLIANEPRLEESAIRKMIRNDFKTLAMWEV